MFAVLGRWRMDGEEVVGNYKGRFRLNGQDWGPQQPLVGEVDGGEWKDSYFIISTWRKRGEQI